MRRGVTSGLCWLTALSALPALAQAPGAAAPAQPNTGDTAWVLASAALVLFMTPGLALFYAGMVRRKNVLGTLLHSFIAMALMSVLWVVIGFSLAFAEGSPFVGGLKYLGMGNMADPVWTGTSIPPMAFMIYQAMFAVITPALISGAVAERMRFGAYVLFIGLWSLLVYCPVAHWVWGADGFLLKMGALDFAGGNVVHVSSGVSALVACLVLGARSKDTEDIPAPHNLGMTVLGAGILWFGWFGFNAGSALGANNLAATAFVNTNTAAATAMLMWCLVEYLRHGRATVLGGVSGAVAGLVAITPAAGFVTPMAAIAIGALVTLVCFTAIELKGRLGYDDSLDAFGVHGVGGATGAMLTGVFALKAVNAAGQDGLLAGNAGLLVTQAVSVVVTAVYAAVVTFILLKVIGALTPLKLSAEEQSDGMDMVLHNEVGYRL
ncbi:MAG: ammonium transporter [Armatimonadetes bacterium]|nr:ammonium transporter [Armatimonadota bacterium]